MPQLAAYQLEDVRRILYAMIDDVVEVVESEDEKTKEIIIDDVIFQPITDSRLQAIVEHIQAAIHAH